MAYCVLELVLDLFRGIELRAAGQGLKHVNFCQTGPFLFPGGQGLMEACSIPQNDVMSPGRGPDQFSKEGPHSLAAHGGHLAENRITAQHVQRAVKVFPIKTLLEGFDDALAPGEGGRPGGGVRRSNASTPPASKVWSHAGMQARARPTASAIMARVYVGRSSPYGRR